MITFERLSQLASEEHLALDFMESHYHKPLIQNFARFHEIQHYLVYFLF